VGLLGALLAQTAPGAIFPVSTTADLIGAVNSANGLPGPHTINLAVGTYDLTAELPAIAVGENITFQGGSANPADTVLHQTAASTRFLETALPGNNVNNIILAFNNLTFTNGQGGDYGGGALLVGGIGSSTTVNNCVFSNNRTSAGANVNAGGAIENSPNGNVTVVGCRFSANSSAVYGGAIDFLNQTGGSGNLMVSDSVFISNSAASDGGAIKASAGPSSITIVDCSFEGNKATGTGRGGAIAHGDGAMTVNYNRFFGNTAAPGNGNTLFQPGGEPTVDASRNWWGQNSGPGATDIFAVGTVTSTPWLLLRFVAGAITLGPGGSTSLTADLLGLSSGGALAAADLAGLPAVPSTPASVFHDAVLGSLSGASTQFAQGIATATFTAGAAKGFASVEASLDNQTSTVTISLPTSVSSINRATATPSNLGSVQWTVTFADSVSGVASGNFSLVNTGLGGSPAITGVTSVGSAPAANWTVTASTGTGAGTLGLNMVSVTGVSAPVSNLPFVGQVYTIDLVPPDTTITANPPTTSGPSVSFSFTGSDVGTGVAGFQSSLDAAPYAPATSPQTFSGLAAGPHTFSVYAIDNAGNVDPTPASYTWTVAASANSPLTAPPQAFVRAPGLTLKIAIAGVLAACSAPSGGTLALDSIGTSAQGATLTLTAAYILYQPASGNNNSDSFSYTISDGLGDTATGTISVIVINPGGLAQTISVSGGAVTVNFAGIPGYTYDIQRATDPGGPWTMVATQTAPANGLFSYTDPSPPAPTAYYRLIEH